MFPVKLGKMPTLAGGLCAFLVELGKIEQMHSANLTTGDQHYAFAQSGLDFELVASFTVTGYMLVTSLRPGPLC